jgi:hypothetical protein
MREVTGGVQNGAAFPVVAPEIPYFFQKCDFGGLVASIIPHYAAGRSKKRLESL